MATAHCLGYGYGHSYSGNSLMRMPSTWSQYSKSSHQLKMITIFCCNTFAVCFYFFVTGSLETCKQDVSLLLHLISGSKPIGGQGQQEIVPHSDLIWVVIFFNVFPTGFSRTEGVCHRSGCGLCTQSRPCHWTMCHQSWSEKLFFLPWFCFCVLIAPAGWTSVQEMNCKGYSLKTNNVKNKANIFYETQM